MRLRNFIKVLCVLIIATTTCYAKNPALDEQIPKAVTIKILGVNDFHGQMIEGKRSGDHPVGSAPVLAAYLKAAEKGMEDQTIIAFTGDQVGASPPVSGLLNDEPSILFLNSLANKFCDEKNRMNPRCNLVAGIGNHEFDKGQQALKDLIYGADRKPTNNWIPIETYLGAAFPYISANIIDEKTKQTMFPPYIIKDIKGTRIAFIGAILKDAPAVILPKNIEGIKFIDEADAINELIPEIKAQGVNSIIVITHQGGEQSTYEGDTKADAQVEGPIVDMVSRLNDGIDVVMAGHTHKFQNAYLKNRSSKQVLVTQANSYSTAFAEITLKIDPKQDTIIEKSARINTTFADQGPGLIPDATAAYFTNLAEKAVEPIVNAQIGTAQTDILRTANAAGESTLGNLIADSFRLLAKTDIAVINPGGLRADVYAGKVTWGNLYAVQPFANYLVKLTLSGSDIYALFEQQWSENYNTILQVSGLTYSYDLQRPLGNRIVAIYINNQILQNDKIYTIATNNFLAGGGDGFTVMTKGNILGTGDTDLNLLINYIKSLPQPFTATIENRIQRVN